MERTKDGLAAARVRGRKGGGRVKMRATKVRQARAMYDEKTYTVQQIAETFGVPRGTIYRHLGDDVRA
nr:helix-turn-helix domain-containing protein [Arthrobacter sp. B0490]